MYISIAERICKKDGTSKRDRKRERNGKEAAGTESGTGAAGEEENLQRIFA